MWLIWYIFLIKDTKHICFIYFIIYEECGTSQWLVKHFLAGGIQVTPCQFNLKDPNKMQKEHYTSYLNFQISNHVFFWEIDDKFMR